MLCSVPYKFFYTTTMRYACIEYFHQFPNEYTKFHFHLPANLANLIKIHDAGALVGVNCHSHAMERKGKSVVARGVTDEFGDFMVDLPSYLHAIPNLEKICRVKVHRIPKGSHCRPATRVGKKQMGIKLSSIGNGIRTYDAGNTRIQHSTSEPLALQAPHIVNNKWSFQTIYCKSTMTHLDGA